MLLGEGSPIGVSDETAKAKYFGLQISPATFRSPPPDAKPSHLQDLGTTLATQSSQNKAPGLGQACCSNGFLANGLHALVIIVFSGEDFAIWVIPGKVTVRVTLSERVPDT